MGLVVQVADTVAEEAEFASFGKLCLYILLIIPIPSFTYLSGANDLYRSLLQCNSLPYHPKHRKLSSGTANVFNGDVEFTKAKVLNYKQL